MTRRWCVYLAALVGGFGFYVFAPGWISWMAVLTVAASPLVSVVIGGGGDALGLFRLPAKPDWEYDWELRPYRSGDALSRVHWKASGKAGKLLLRQEKLWQRPKRKMPWFVPVAISFAILFCIFPPWRFEGIFLQTASVRLDLTAGGREKSRQAMLDVVSSESQRLYLRQQVFDVYAGDRWQAEAGEGSWILESIGSVRIATRSGQEYAFSQMRQEICGKPWGYLQLPWETRAWAKGILAKNGDSVAEICEFVRLCASYDEAPVAMPAGGDFARWFLEESGKGYCVHFATLAAVLLRSAGVPARLVTGFVVDVQAGIRTTVTGEDAHAWVEYWEDGTWHILEVTPSVTAVPIGEKKEEKHRFDGNWVLILLALAVQEWSLRRFGFWEDPRIRALKLKAAFSRNGLSEAERELLKLLRKSLPCARGGVSRSG